MKFKLELMDEKDEAWLYQLNSNPKVMKFFPFVLNREKNAELLKGIMDHQQKYGFGVSKIIVNGSQPAGILGFNRVQFECFFTPCIEVLWRIHPDFWNRGLATGAAKACMEYAESILKFKELFSFASVYNLASIRVMEKSGMKKIAVFNHPKISKDHWLSDHVLFKKLFL